MSTARLKRNEGSRQYVLWDLLDYLDLGVGAKVRVDITTIEVLKGGILDFGNISLKLTERLKERKVGTKLPEEFVFFTPFPLPRRVKFVDFLGVVITINGKIGLIKDRETRIVPTPF